MKIKTRIISLSILAILTACMLNVAVASAATPQPTPKLVGDTLSIHASQTYVYSGQTVYFSGYLTNSYGYGMGGMYGNIYDNGRWIGSFYTASDGSWGPIAITFGSAAGTRYVEAVCDDIPVGLYIQVN